MALTLTGILASIGQLRDTMPVCKPGDERTDPEGSQYRCAADGTGWEKLKEGKKAPDREPTPGRRA